MSPPTYRPKWRQKIHAREAIPRTGARCVPQSGLVKLGQTTVTTSRKVSSVWGQNNTKKPNAIIKKSLIKPIFDNPPPLNTQSEMGILSNQTGFSDSSSSDSVTDINRNLPAMHLNNTENHFAVSSEFGSQVHPNSEEKALPDNNRIATFSTKPLCLEKRDQSTMTDLTMREISVLGDRLNELERSNANRDRIQAVEDKVSKLEELNLKLQKDNKELVNVVKDLVTTKATPKVEIVTLD